MANFIISYDLNGPIPTHSEMDQHIQQLPGGGVYGRLLETVWYCSFDGSTSDLFRYVVQILRPEDRLLVVEIQAATWRNLLVDKDAFWATLNHYERL